MWTCGHRTGGSGKLAGTGYGLYLFLMTHTVRRSFDTLDTCFRRGPKEPQERDKILVSPRLTIHFHHCLFKVLLSFLPSFTSFLHLLPSFSSFKGRETPAAQLLPSFTSFLHLLRSFSSFKGRETPAAQILNYKNAEQLTSPAGNYITPAPPAGHDGQG